MRRQSGLGKFWLTQMRIKRTRVVTGDPLNLESVGLFARKVADFCFRKKNCSSENGTDPLAHERRKLNCTKLLQKYTRKKKKNK